MNARTYENFDLLIEPVAVTGAAPGERTTYTARVTDSPVAQGAALTFRLPMDEQTLALLLTRFDPGRSGIRRGPASPQSQAGTQLGTALFSAVFDGAVGREWQRSLDRVDGTEQQGRRGGLRLRLRLDGAPQLAGLPWELLRDPDNGGSWVAQSDRTPVVRTLSAAEPLPPLALSGPLRVLTVISSPTDLTELDVEGEWARMQEALAGPLATKTVVVDRLPEPTTTALATWLRRHDVHVLHFVGHGESVSGEGVLYFCDAYGRSNPVDASVLGPFVHDHDPLRLVVLNACRSAVGDTTDPYAGMAQGLGVQGAAAVVAMQFPISDRAALAFTSGLYGALADGLPVDQAVTSTRKLMLGDFGGEWATPVLFLRGEDGRVFDSAPTALSPPEPEPEPVEAVAPAPGDTPPPSTVRPFAGVAPDRGPVAVEPVVPSSEPVLPSSLPDLPGDLPRDDLPRDDLVRDDRARDALVTDLRPPLRRGLLSGAGVLVLLLALVVTLTLRSRTSVLEPALGATTTGGPAATGASSPAKPGPSSPPPPASGGTSGSASSPTGGGLVAASRGATAIAHRFAAPPTVDGQGTEWTGQPVVVADSVVYSSSPDRPAPTARWQLGWDEGHLYAYAVVTDPTVTGVDPTHPELGWRGDSVSFEIGRWLDQVHTTVLEDGDSHVIVGLVPPDRAVLARNVPRGASLIAGPPLTGVDYHVLPRPDGYTVEASFPWSSLGLSSPREGTQLALNLDVSDAVDAGPRRGELATMMSTNPYRTSNDAKSRARWGMLVLTG